MKTEIKLAGILSLLMVAGCAHHERQHARYDDTTSSAAYSATPKTSVNEKNADVDAHQKSKPTANETVAAVDAAAETKTTANETAAAVAAAQKNASPSDTTASASDPTVLQVRQALSNNPNLTEVVPNIQVSGTGGTIVLTGTVPNEQQKQAVETAVKSTTGVVSVNNQLEVNLSPTGKRPDQSNRIYHENKELSPTSNSSENRRYPAGQSNLSSSSAGAIDANIQARSETDRAIGLRIVTELQSDSAVAGTIPMVQISVDNGKATLTGTVDTQEEKRMIEADVHNVAGVTSVKNKLRVAGGVPVETPAQRLQERFQQNVFSL